jgi:hypothetical protein
MMSSVGFATLVGSSAYRSSACGAPAATLQATSSGPVSPSRSAAVMVMLVAIGVRLVAEELERPQRGGGEVERRRRVAAASERVERPDHGGGADIEVLERQVRPPAVPLVRGPERRCIERRIGVRDDRGDRVSDTSRVPRLVGQSLELRRQPRTPGIASFDEPLRRPRPRREEHFPAGSAPSKTALRNIDRGGERHEPPRSAGMRALDTDG